MRRVDGDEGHDERISITVPRELAEELRGMSEDGVIDSVSAFVTRCVTGEMGRERWRRERVQRRRGAAGMDDESAVLARRWAADVASQRTTLPLDEYIGAARRSSV